MEVGKTYIFDDPRVMVKPDGELVAWSVLLFKVVKMYDRVAAVKVINGNMEAILNYKDYNFKEIKHAL